MYSSLYNVVRQRLIGFPSGHPDLFSNRNYMVQELLSGSRWDKPKKLSAGKIMTNATTYGKVYRYVATL